MKIRAITALSIFLISVSAASAMQAIVDSLEWSLHSATAAAVVEVASVTRVKPTEVELRFGTREVLKGHPLENTTDHLQVDPSAHPGELGAAPAVGHRYLLCWRGTKLYRSIDLDTPRATDPVIASDLNLLGDGPHILSAARAYLKRDPSTGDQNFRRLDIPRTGSAGRPHFRSGGYLIVPR